MKNLLEDEAVVVGGSNHSHATADLYDAIAAGDYPEWKLLIQVRAALGGWPAAACSWWASWWAVGVKGPQDPQYSMCHACVHVVPR